MGGSREALHTSRMMTSGGVLSDLWGPEEPETAKNTMTERMTRERTPIEMKINLSF